jgi:hypothetical protein
MERTSANMRTRQAGTAPMPQVDAMRTLKTLRYE